ncbi:hypothetical protein YQE_04586, partial [Dendroctonus ponderosae]
MPNNILLVNREDLYLTILVETQLSTNMTVWVEQQV